MDQSDGESMISENNRTTSLARAYSPTPARYSELAAPEIPRSDYPQFEWDYDSKSFSRRAGHGV